MNWYKSCPTFWVQFKRQTYGNWNNKNRVEQYDSAWQSASRNNPEEAYSWSLEWTEMPPPEKAVYATATRPQGSVLSNTLPTGTDNKRRVARLKVYIGSGRKKSDCRYWVLCWLRSSIGTRRWRQSGFSLILVWNLSHASLRFRSELCPKFSFL